MCSAPPSRSTTVGEHSGDQIGSRLHPALHPFLGTRIDLSTNTIGPLRESLNQRRAEAASALDTTGLVIADDTVPGEAGRTIAVRSYRGGSERAPVVLYCHSGAFVLGNLDIDHRQCVELARRGRCTLVSVDYPLAPEHPYPAGRNHGVQVLWGLAEYAGA